MGLKNDPLWYKDAVIYQLHVKSFFDSNADGIGDFRGLLEKLDYIERLGIDTLWLLPFYPSPLRDDGYDISDYTGIHASYGKLSDFKEFLSQAHKRGIRVVIELVLNHTSDQHPWFKKARISDPVSSARNFYVWSDTPDKYSEARIIFKDYENSNWAWDPVAKAYYWHRFYSHQPDLNFDNPEVCRALAQVVNFWLKLGVDGLRLDAVPYLFERETTPCENLPETFEYLRKLRAGIDKKFKNRMLLAEANQWPEEAANYFGSGNICQMAFHFPLMPRLFMSLHMEDRFPIINILEQTPKIPDNAQWAVFLRNHDELTLEMVTDEERDYMYSVFAHDRTARINLGIRRRLAPLLGSSRKKIELMNILLFSMPGTPVIYYGDEIGMGDNYYLGDRNGVRTPMQWSSDRNAGFSRANPQQLYLPVIIDPEYHFEALNVETMENNPSSLLWWMRRVIGLRKKYQAFGRGDIEFINPKNPSVLAFTRRYGDEIILVVINLSRFACATELDLSKYSGYVPVELMSRNRFPVIRDTPYNFTLGFHAYFWFVLQKEEQLFRIEKRKSVPLLEISEKPGMPFSREFRTLLEKDVLPDYLRECRWFSGKAHRLTEVKITDEAVLPGNGGGDFFFLVLETKFMSCPQENYLMPVSFIPPSSALTFEERNKEAVLARIKEKEGHTLLADAMYDARFQALLPELISRKKKLHGRAGIFYGESEKNAIKAPGNSQVFSGQVLRQEQSNTSVVYGEEFIFKLYRKISEGKNPEVEILKNLTQYTPFRNIPVYLGGIEYLRHSSDPASAGLLYSYIKNQSDGWKYANDLLKTYYERILSDTANTPPPGAELFPEAAGALFCDMIALLGKRTAQLHDALYSIPEPAFCPEAVTGLYQRGLFQALKNNLRKSISMLRENLPDFQDRKITANDLAGIEKKILAYYETSVLKRKKFPCRMRIHGDYHLGQVLFTGQDFYIIDFEGEPSRSHGERISKALAVKDLAGMMRSFQYAAFNAMHKMASVRKEDIARLTPWALTWHKETSAIFLNSYIKSVSCKGFIPEDRAELEGLVRVFLLDKALYEVSYELNHRPGWVHIPLSAILALAEME